MITQSVSTYFAAGKLMLFGEYLVLKGAPCLAIPLKFGQELAVSSVNKPEIHWESKALDKSWFTACLDLNGQIISSSNEEIAAILSQLMQLIRSEKPHLFTEGLQFTVNANFDLAWGLGSSSTLLSLLAQWSDMNVFELSNKSFGGSGYDVACATEQAPILYNADQHNVHPIRLSPAITSQLLFVYSGNKQNSRNEIKRFSSLNCSQQQVDEMTQIIEDVTHTHDIEAFEFSINESERIMSNILEVPTLKGENFSDYPHGIKSLGAWGGDFFMATFRNEEDARSYFNQKGYFTQFNYSEIIR